MQVFAFINYNEILYTTIVEGIEEPQAEYFLYLFYRREIMSHRQGNPVALGP